jgi:hypothetical protein
LKCTGLVSEPQNLSEGSLVCGTGRRCGVERLRLGCRADLGRGILVSQPRLELPGIGAHAQTGVEQLGARAGRVGAEG